MAQFQTDNKKMSQSQTTTEISNRRRLC